MQGESISIMFKSDEPAKVLFISAPFGSGHIRAAQAVMSALHNLLPIDSKLVNVFDFISPFIGRTILKTYLKILDIYPQAYGMMYGWGNTSRIAIWSREIINSYLANKMYKYISSYNPDIIVCTHATPAGLVARLIKEKLIKVPTVGIITDFVMHRWWVYSEIDYYCVAHKGMQDYLSDYGIGNDRIFVTGIPIDLSFTQKHNNKQIFDKLNLDPNRFTVLLMGGGAGVLPMDKILKVCDNINRQVQFIIVTGNNKKMYKTIGNICDSLKNEIRLFSFVNNVNELMSISNVLITKPGGMTTAEALAVGVPMLIYRPIPGQEEENTKFLTERNIAIRCDNIAEIKNAMLALIADRQLLDKQKQQARLWAQPYAASNISDLIVKKIQ